MTEQNTKQNTNYDSPWKEIIEDYFPQFLEFFFNDAYLEIDWERPYEFLDMELQQLEPDAEIGKRLVDKVAKVWLLNGEEAWVLIHVEVQGQYDSEFPLRMYIYNYRLFDRHKKRVISLAVLADNNINWRPQSYGYQLGGCQVSLEFPTVKLLDYEAQWESLEETENPFGLVVMAHLKTKATSQNPESRLQWKLRLVRSLFAKGYSREEVIRLFRFIDWIMFLPKELADDFKVELRNEEESNRMRYVTSIERLAKEEAVIQTLRENVIDNLTTRFEQVPTQVVEAVNRIDDVAVLKSLLRRAILVSSIAEFEDDLNEVRD